MKNKKNAPHLTAEAMAKRATQEARAAEAANVDRHPSTADTTPRRYLVAAYSVAMLKAEAADKEVTKSRRKATTAERKAQTEERRAEAVGTEAAAEKAARARAAADLARTEANAAERRAEAAHADPAAILHTFTLTEQSVTAAHELAAAVIADQEKEGKLPPIGQIRVYIDPRIIACRADQEKTAAYLLQCAKVRYTEAANDAERASAAAAVGQARQEYAAAKRETERAAALVLAAGAEQIARRVAARMVEREGTPTQWNILHAAEARKHFDNDLFEMIAAAREPMAAIIYGTEATAADLETMAATVGAKLTSRDRYTRESVTEGERTEARAAARLAAILRNKLANPGGVTWIIDMYRAAFLAVNDHLTACRSIRTDEKPAPLSLEDMNTESEDFAVNYSAEAAERSATLRKAFASAADKMPPVRRQVFTLLGKGYNAAQIAHRMNRSRGLICQHRDHIAANVAEALTDTAPTLAATIRAAAIIQNAAEAARAARAEKAAAIDAAYAAAVSVDAALQAIKKAVTAHQAEKAALDTEAGREILRAAIHKFTAVRRQVWGFFENGNGYRATARAMRRDPKTIQEHMNAAHNALYLAALDVSMEFAETVKAADIATLAVLLK